MCCVMGLLAVSWPSFWKTQGFDNFAVKHMRSTQCKSQCNFVFHSLGFHGWRNLCQWFLEDNVTKIKQNQCFMHNILVYFYCMYYVVGLDAWISFSSLENITFNVERFLFCFLLQHWVWSVGPFSSSNLLAPAQKLYCTFLWLNNQKKAV